MIDNKVTIAKGCGGRYNTINATHYSKASSFVAIKANLRSNSELLKADLTRRDAKMLVLVVFLIPSSG